VKAIKFILQNLIIKTLKRCRPKGGPKENKKTANCGGLFPSGYSIALEHHGDGARLVLQDKASHRNCKV
jgi:hypothetical protein